LPSDAIAGIALAAYAIPVSLAYAGLAGLPPQVGLYGYQLGGVGYALFGSSRQLAIGPTSAISLMIAGTVGAMAGGDALRYGEIASLTGFTVAALCLIAWVFQLSVLVKLISDSILVGFKAGAGLTIAMTQKKCWKLWKPGNRPLISMTYPVSRVVADWKPWKPQQNISRMRFPEFLVIGNRFPEFGNLLIY
jgi:MFS superfamily sulfate permease-like transporter